MSATNPINVNVVVKSNTAGVKEAQGAIGSFGDSLSSVLQIAAGFSLANVGMQVGQFVRDTVVGTVEMTANFDKMMHTIQGNTAMSNADLGVMRDTILDLGAKSGVPLDQLANGFMHITNEGYSASSSVTILNAAMKAAVDTGGNAGNIANSLAVIMHDFGAKANEASNYMNILMSITAHGNLTLEDLAGNFQKVSSIASNAHVPIQQLGSLFDVLTRATGDAAEAQTQEERLLTSIIKPTREQITALGELSGASGGATKASKDYSDQITKTKNTLDAQNITLTEAIKKHGEHSDAVKKLQDHIANTNLTLAEYTAKQDKTTQSTKALGAATGIDLAADFTAAGLQAKGLTGILQDVYTATNGNSEALAKLFPDQRAFVGITALMKDNLSEYKGLVKQAGDATNNDLLNKDFQTRLGDLDVKWNRLKISAGEFGMRIASSVLPSLGQMVDGIDHVLKGFNDYMTKLDQVSSKTKQHADAQKGIWQQLTEATGTILSSSAIFLETIFSGLWKDLGNITRDGGVIIYGIVQTLTGLLQGTINSFIMGFTTSWQQGLDLAAQAWGNFGMGILTIAKGVAMAVFDIFEGLVDGIIGLLNGAFAGIVNAANQTLGTKYTAPKIPTLAGSGISASAGIDAIMQGVTGMPAKAGSVNAPAPSYVPLVSGPAAGQQTTVNVYNQNTFNTQYDPTNYAKYLGIQISNALH